MQQRNIQDARYREIAPFSANIAPLAMLVGVFFFVIYGAPRYSLDARRSR